VTRTISISRTLVLTLGQEAMAALAREG